MKTIRYIALGKGMAKNTEIMTWLAVEGLVFRFYGLRPGGVF